MSVLFVDLVAFTERSDNADPEDVRELLQAYHREAKTRIEHFGGVVEKFIGDAVMAVFGAPIAHGDDAERAVRAGLDVLDGVEEQNRVHGLALAARAAVNTGDAIVSLQAIPGEPIAVGDVVNTAARLQAAAPPGRLIVGLATYRATRAAVAYEPLAPFAAKGKADELEAWLAVLPTLEPGERRSKLTPFVGRDRELELVRSLWHGCLTEARPYLLTVLGAPGIGKSRLCRELAHEVEADGGRVVRGRCLPYGQGAGYQAFAGIVGNVAGILESDTPQAGRSKLRSALDRLMPAAEVDEVCEGLALLAGLPAEVESPQRLMLFFYARRFLEALAVESPTAIVFEDIHWAQPSEVELLGYLAKHVRDVPLMLVAAARPELLDTHPTWGAGLTTQTTLALDPLATDAAAVLVVELVPPDDQSRGRLDQVIEAAGGNPLFLEELSASLGERGDGDRLPITVREAISARIDALPPNVRAILLAASVVGRTFWRGIVASVAETEEIDEALAELEARDLVRRDARSELAGDVQFTFKHMLIRDVAYSTLPRAMRRARHAAVAEYVESSIADGAETLSPILAHHWSEAGEPARAIPYLVAAAETARRGWAQDAAIDLYTTAIELAPDDELRRRLRLERAIALVGWWQMERAAAELSGLLTELSGSERLEALIALGHAYVWTEQGDEALATAAEAAAAGAGAQGSTNAAIVAMEAQALAMRGAEGDLDRAWELGQQALDAWEPGERPVDLTHHLHLHTDTAYWTGRYEQALELARRTRSTASDVHVAEAFLRGGGSEALSLAGLGRHEEAIAIWDELLPAADELGRSRAGLLNYSSLAYRELYDIDEARRRSEEALELSPTTGFGMPRQFAGSDLLFAHVLAGDVGRAERDWPERWNALDHATAWTTWLIAGRLAVVRSELALQTGDPESALEWAHRSHEIARRTRRRKYEARSLTLVGEALSRLGRRDEALEALEAAVPIADALIGAPARWEARAALARCAYNLGADAVAASAYEEASELLTRFADTLNPVRAQRFLATPQVRAILSA